MSDDVIRIYEEQYKDTGADGIYFQSFTETDVEYIGGKLIAQVVTEFVNSVADKLLGKYPNLFIQFGLHALSSVHNHLDYISQIDKRVEIMWEDCGSFPYHYFPVIKSEKDYQTTVEYTDKIMNLRAEGSYSMLFKGLMTLDWEGERFVHQSGPYILGVSNERLIKHDIEMLKPTWRNYQSGWIQNGKYAYDMAKHIYENKSNVTVGMAAQLAGGMWFPEALCAQILWECDKPYAEIFDKVLKRRSVDIV